MNKKVRKFSQFCAVSAIALAAVPAAADAAPRQQFNITAQSLSSAILQFSEQADVSVIVSDDLVRGLKANPVRGNLAPEDALKQMLRGTSLRVRKGKGGALVIVRSGAAAAAQSSSVEAVPAGTDVRGTPGAVVDEATGAPLRGALVVVDATGETASTDDLGRFRITGLDGVHRLTISYLGYAPVQRDVEFRDGRPVSRMVLSNLSVNGEIVVVGALSARAQAINEERTADNSSTVISSDLLGQFNGTTIAESLRRAPGVAFTRDANTGDGANLIVRGLPSDYNQVQINGVTIPISGAEFRSANLGNILADSISKVTINKTLMPSQDSGGTGGLVEIETKSPLERPKRFANISVQGLKRGKGFGDEYQIAGTLSAKLGGAENFGISLSYQRRKQDVTNANYYTNELFIFPSYLPLGEDGRPLTSLSAIDPRTPFPFEEGASDHYPGFMNLGTTRTRSATEAITAGLAWEPFDGTNWRFDYIRSNQNSKTEIASSSVRLYTYYGPAPIPSLDGEIRYAQQPFFAESGFSYASSDRDDNTDSLSFRGDSAFGPWQIRYSAGYSRSKRFSPADYSFDFGTSDGAAGIFFDPSLALPEAFNPDTGFLTSFFGKSGGRGVPQPLLTQEGLDYLSNADAIAFRSGTFFTIGGRSDIKKGQLSFKRDFKSGILEHIEFGAEYNDSTSRSAAQNGVAYIPLPYPEPFYSPPASVLGIEFDNLDFASLFGPAAGFKRPSNASMNAFIGRLPSLLEDGEYLETFEQPSGRGSRTGEEEIAGFLQGKIILGKIDIVGGVRFSQVNVDSSFFTTDNFVSAAGIPDVAFREASSRFISQSARQQNWLPRILVNYRPRTDIVVRAGYYSTTARPPIELMTDGQGVTLDMRPRYGPGRNQPQLTVAKGNPDLKPTSTHNFDLSFEHYSQSLGVVKASVYLKLMKNLLESTELNSFDDLDGVILPDDPRFQNLPSNIFISARMPFNNPETAKSWGAEFSIERQLDFISDAFRGFGIYANYTYSDSSKTQPLTWSARPVYNDAGVVVSVINEVLYIKDVRFNGQPPHSGTLGLTYNRHGIDASLYYTVQSRRLTSFAQWNLHQFDEAAETLDLRLQYSTQIGGAKARIFLVGNDLLKGRKDANNEITLGGTGATPKYYTGANYLGGRTVSAGISIDF